MALLKLRLLFISKFELVSALIFVGSKKYLIKF